MTEKHPRLLVATEFPPNAPGGGPAVVRQMLAGWPVDCLYWWSCLPERDGRFGQKTAVHRVAAIPSRLYPNQRWAGQKAWLLERVWTPWAAQDFRKTAAMFRPAVAWVIPHAWAVPPLAKALPGAGVPFHTTVQDYCDTHARVERFGAARCGRMTALAGHLYSHATTRDATSHPMIADLRARTGAEAAQMLHAGLEQSDFDYLAGQPTAQAGEIRIAYAGTIVVEPAFELFVKALVRIRKQLPAPVTLEFFTSHSYRARGWFDPAWMREQGNLPEPALTHALRQCAWGFAAMSLTDDDPRYNRFSFPTKFISYLAAGLPVITLGHRESSVMKMAEAYGVGPCMTTDNPEKLSAELQMALADPAAATRYRPAIRRCALAEFDARRMRAVLHRCFYQCARKPA